VSRQPSPPEANSTATGAKKKILVVECARGFAALYVLLHHARNIGGLSTLFSGAKYPLYLLDFGPEMVLIFFFLSGFSIHYSNRHRQLDQPADCLQYYYLRFRRIYPLFFIAIGLTLLLSMAGSLLVPKIDLVTKPDASLIGTFFFLSDIHDGRWFASPATNPALWSLSYEVVYYVLYLAFWRLFKIAGINKAFAASLLFSAAFAGIGLSFPNHLSNVFSLYWLWTAGALLADWRVTDKVYRVNPVIYYSLIFTAFGASRALFRTLPAPFDLWLEGLFIGSVMMTYLLEIEPQTFRSKVVGAAVVVSLSVMLAAITGHLPVLGRHIFLDAEYFIFALVLIVVMGCGFTLRGFCSAILRPFLNSGAWSYALYVVHMPILYFLGSVFQNPYLRAAAVVMVLPPICWLAKWLELKVQPQITDRMDFVWSRIKPGTMASGAS